MRLLEMPWLQVHGKLGHEPRGSRDAPHGSKALISLLVKDMHTHRAATYDTRLTRCINLPLRHSTLLIGWLQYEAFIASKEEELMRALNPTVQV